MIFLKPQGNYCNFPRIFEALLYQLWILNFTNKSEKSLGTEKNRKLAKFLRKLDSKTEKEKKKEAFSEKWN